MLINQTSADLVSTLAWSALNRCSAGVSGRSYSQTLAALIGVRTSGDGTVWQARAGSQFSQGLLAIKFQRMQALGPAAPALDFLLFPQIGHTQQSVSGSKISEFFQVS